MKIIIALGTLILITLAVLCLWNSKNQWVNEGTTTSEKDSVTFTLTYKTTLRNHLFHPFATATILQFQANSPNKQFPFQTVLPNISLKEAQKLVNFETSRAGLSLRFKGAELHFVPHQGLNSLNP